MHIETVLDLGVNIDTDMHIHIRAQVDLDLDLDVNSDIIRDIDMYIDIENTQI